jgi:hypothetical protein
MYTDRMYLSRVSVVDCQRRGSISADAPDRDAKAFKPKARNGSHQLHEMFQMYEEDGSVQSDDRFKLKDQVRNSLAWRLNLTSAESSKRLEQIVAALKAKLDQQADENVDLKQAVGAIQRSFDTVFQVWYSFSTAFA